MRRNLSFVPVTYRSSEYKTGIQFLVQLYDANNSCQIAILLPPAGNVFKQSGIPSGEVRLKGRLYVDLFIFKLFNILFSPW